MSFITVAEMKRRATDIAVEAVESGLSNTEYGERLRAAEREWRAGFHGQFSSHLSESLHKQIFDIAASGVVSSDYASIEARYRSIVSVIQTAIEENES